MDSESRESHSTKRIIEPGVTGDIVIKLPMPPGFMSSLYKNDERFKSSYLNDYPGYYNTGDVGYMDEDGYVFVTSRADDVIKVSGHRLSTGAMEEALSTHPDVCETAVVGVKCTLKGQRPLGLIIRHKHSTVSEESLREELVALIRNRIGPVAVFKNVIFVPR
jgi:propionyl-CoA synthetase